MKIKLLTDSSANICKNIKRDILYAPLKIVTKEKEYIDNADLDVAKMLKELKEYKGTSSTACPSVDDWTYAFDGGDIIFGVAISGNISGSYNSARIASEDYKGKNPNSKIFIFDSLSAGPELEILLEKIDELISNDFSFEDVCKKIKDYSKHTHLVFSLESLDNFAKNGRVNPVIAKAAGLLGLRIVCKASDKGDLQPIHKCRGENKALNQIIATMKEMKFKGGKVRISHTFNENGAKTLEKMIINEFGKCDIMITENRGLCAYYCEAGGILVGFEDEN